MWNLKSHRWIYSLLFVFSVAFISLFGLSSDSFADSDITYNFDGSSVVYICDNSSSSLPHCSDYSYVKISFSSYSTTLIQLQFFSPSQSNGAVPSLSDIIISVSSLSKFNIYPLASPLYGSAILTDSLASCPTCPICPEIPENPYDDKLDSIRNAIILVPAVCLLLYFFYVIFGIIIPTTGGKK